MTIQGRAGLIAVVSALLLALLLFAGYGWLQEHDARLKAESQSSLQQKQLDGIKQQENETQQALASKVAVIERERNRPATAAQVISDTNDLIPSLPQALNVEDAPSALPNGPAIQSIVIPEADFKSIRDAQLTCEENSVKLTACQSLQADSKQQLALTAAQRDEWKTAAKGGSVWHKALGAAKWFAVGAASGAVIYAAGHHK
jgi:hypothetical protein